MKGALISAAAAVGEDDPIDARGHFLNSPDQLGNGRDAIVVEVSV